MLYYIKGNTVMHVMSCSTVEHVTKTHVFHLFNIVHYITIVCLHA